MTHQSTPKQARPKERIRKAAQVFRTLEPSPAKPLASVPIGLWITGWLPKPQGAAS